MRESIVENYLRGRVEALGGRCLKFVSPGRKGVPDRIVQWAAQYGPTTGYLDAETHYVELKAPGKAARKDGQTREHDWLRRNGFAVYVLDTKAAVDYYIEEIQRARG